MPLFLLEIKILHAAMLNTAYSNQSILGAWMEHLLGSEVLTRMRGPYRVELPAARNFQITAPSRQC